MAFLVFEGIDGAGKSTLINKLSQELTRNSQPHLITREPGGTVLGESLREILLKVGGQVPSPRTELLLMEAARAQHVSEKINPALKRGEWVLCDRFTASSLAFQVGGRGVEREQVDWLNAFATAGCSPDLNVLLDLSPDKGQLRMTGAGREKDRFEGEAASFHQNVRNYYVRLAKEEPQKWLVLDAEKNENQLFAELITALKVKKWLVF